MTSLDIIGFGSVLGAGLAIGFGAIGAAIGEGMAAAAALRSMAQQPDQTNTFTRTMFISMAMIESTSIYAFVIAMILIFANPIWNHAVKASGG